MKPEIIYEDKDLVVLNKPAGMQVHHANVRHATGVNIATFTLADWLAERYPEMRTVGDDPAMRPGIVHRLDKATSGIMVAAKTQDAFLYLKKLFENRTVQKTYLALVAGRPKEKHAVIDVPIGISTGTLKRSVRSKKMSKPAVTEFWVLKTFTNHGERAEKNGTANKKENEESLLRVFPKTGRTHQIRVHLASIGNPIIGDRLYGYGRPKAKGDKNIEKEKKEEIPEPLMLHALSLEFTGPDGKRVKFEADPPAYWRKLLKQVIHT